MKKVFFVLAACAVVSAALVGCGSSSSPESQSVATSDNAVAQNKQQEPKKSQKALL